MQVYRYTKVDVCSNSYTGIHVYKWYMRYHGCEVVARVRDFAITATLNVEGGYCALRAQVQC